MILHHIIYMCINQKYMYQCVHVRMFKTSMVATVNYVE